MKPAEPTAKIIDLNNARLKKLDDFTLVLMRNEWYKEYMYLEAAERNYDITAAATARNTLYDYQAEIRRRNLSYSENESGFWSI